MAGNNLLEQQGSGYGYGYGSGDGSGYEDEGH